MRLTASFAAAILAGSGASETQTIALPFDQCLEAIISTGRQLDVLPSDIRNVPDGVQVRFDTTDGTVLVTCSRTNARMVIVKTPNPR